MTAASSLRAAESDVLATFRRLRLVPVIVIEDPRDAVPLGAALIAGGLACAEITMRTPDAADAIERLTQEHSGMLVGAGTVLTPQQASRALDAGAKFIVAPGFSSVVVDYCLERGAPVYPGVCTPTEIEMALARGLHVLKFFPAEAAGGLTFLKAIAAPYVGVEFMPTGGINADNLASYLGFKRVVACGGSWMAPTEWIATKQFDRICATTERALQIVRESASTPGAA